MCKRLTILGLAAVLLGLSGCVARQETRPEAQPATTFILLMHAETDPVYVDRLSPRGLERVRLLSKALAGYSITAVYCTDYRRTIQTVYPLGRDLGIDPIPMPTHRGFYHPQRIPRLVKRLRTAHPGQTLVWVGSDLSVRALYQGLGGPGKPPLLPGEIAVVTYTGSGAATERRLRYGD